VLPPFQVRGPESSGADFDSLHYQKQIQKARFDRKKKRPDNGLIMAERFRCGDRLKYQAGKLKRQQG